MFNIGFGELLVVFIVALVVLGPEKLPEFAKKLAKIAKEIKKVLNSL